MRIYDKLCDRHAERLPNCPGLLPILAGRARDLALRPDRHGSEHGRRMRRIRGGKHVQRRYREQRWHPLASVRKAWGLWRIAHRLTTNLLHKSPSYGETSMGAFRRGEGHWIPSGARRAAQNCSVCGEGWAERDDVLVRSGRPPGTPAENLLPAFHFLRRWSSSAYRAPH